MSSLFIVPCYDMKKSSLNLANLTAIAKALNLKAPSGSTKRTLCDAVNSVRSGAQVKIIADQLQKMGFTVHWDIEKVDLNDRRVNEKGQVFVRVKWLGMEQDTYEPIENVSADNVALGPPLIVIGPTQQNEMTPEQVRMIADGKFTMIAAGNYVTAALRKNGEFAMWGMTDILYKPSDFASRGRRVVKVAAAANILAVLLQNKGSSQVGCNFR